jgi:hypothetical protein
MSHDLSLYVSRFNLFATTLEEIAREYEATMVAEPRVRTPATLLVYLSEELQHRRPLRSWSSVEFVAAESKRILTDRVVAREPVLLAAFDAVAGAADQIKICKRKQRSSYNLHPLRQSVSVASVEFYRGRYFDEALRQIDELLAVAPTPKFYENIRWLSEVLVGSFIAVGCSAEAVVSYSHNIRDAGSCANGHVFTRFPIKTQYRSYLQELRFRREAYNAAVLGELASLTVSDRVRSLSRFFYADPSKITVLSPVYGMKSLREIRIGDVLLYPVLAGRSRYVQCASSSTIGSWESFGPRSEQNISITLLARDNAAAHLAAIEEFSAALDIVAFRAPGAMPLSADPHKATFVDEHGHFRGQSLGVDPGDTEYEEILSSRFDLASKELLDSFTETADRIAMVGDERDRQRLRDAMRALRRSYEVVRVEDQLLEAWIVLEALLGDESGVIIADPEGRRTDVAERRIAILASSIFIDDYRWRVGYTAHTELQRAVSHQRMMGTRELVDAPDDMLNSLGFVAPAPAMQIRQMVRNVETIVPFIRDPVLEAKVSRALNFYTDAVTASTRMRELRKNVLAEVVVMYQLRNRFVHQARRSLELLRYYARRARRYSALVVGTVLSAPHNRSHVSVFQEIIDRSAQLERDVPADVSALLK